MDRPEIKRRAAGGHERVLDLDGQSIVDTFKRRESTERALRCRLVPCLPLQREPRTPDKALSGDEDELAACGARHGTGSSGRASRAATCTRSPCVASPVKVSGKRATGTGSACFLQDPPAPGRPSSFQRACELDGEAIKMAALPALQL